MLFRCSPLPGPCSLTRAACSWTNTEGLAPLIVRDIAEIIVQLKNEGMAILLAEQNVPIAPGVADYVHILSKGAIVHSSLPWAREDSKSQYLGV